MAQACQRELGNKDHVGAHDGSDLMLIVLAVALIGLAVWTVSKLFPAQRGR
jgi:hypothetical protein